MHPRNKRLVEKSKEMEMAQRMWHLFNMAKGMQPKVQAV
jgi:hypothetical protein